MLGIVLPVSLLAIALAATFAYLFFKYKRRYAVSSLSAPSREIPIQFDGLCLHSQ